MPCLHELSTVFVSGTFDFFNVCMKTAPQPHGTALNPFLNGTKNGDVGGRCERGSILKFKHLLTNQISRGYLPLFAHYLDQALQPATKTSQKKGYSVHCKRRQCVLQIDIF